MPPEIIETHRLILRPLIPDDAAAVFEYACDPDVTRYMDWPTHRSMKTSLDWIQLTASQWASQEEFTWGVTVKDEGTDVVGAVGCRAIDFQVSFGYVLNRQQWNKGFATEAAKALVETLSRIEGVKRVWATCDVDNHASANVLTKSGCELEGTLRKWAIRPNLPGAPARDSLMYAKIIDS